MEFTRCIPYELNLLSDPISRTSRISRRVSAYYPGKSCIVELSLSVHLLMPALPFQVANWLEQNVRLRETPELAGSAGRRTGEPRPRLHSAST